MAPTSDLLPAACTMVCLRWPAVLLAIGHFLPRSVGGRDLMDLVEDCSEEVNVLDATKFPQGS